MKNKNGIFESDNGVAIRYADLPESKLKDGLSNFFNRYGSLPEFLDLLSDIEDGVSDVRLSPMTEGRWDSRIVSGRVQIRADPRYRAGRENPGRLLHHEIKHQTRTANAYSKAKTEQFISDNPQKFRTYIKSVGGDRNGAKAVINYAYEERYVVERDNEFAVLIGESKSKVYRFDTYATFYVGYYNNYLADHGHA